MPFGLPFRPTPYTATFALTIGGAEIATTLPVQYRSEEDIYSGEKRQELHVVPKFAVSATPQVAIVPLGATTRRDVRVTVTNHSKGAAQAQVALQMPQGWRVTPASAPRLSREDEQATARFILQPPPGLNPARAEIHAMVHEGAASFALGYQVVEYPHTTRRHVLRDPSIAVKALDVKVKPHLTVGYVEGVGDEVAEAIEQLGARVEFLNADDLAWGELRALRRDYDGRARVRAPGRSARA